MNWFSIQNLKDLALRNAQKVFNYAINFTVAKYLKAMLFAVASLFFSIQNIFKEGIKQLFPNTATGEFLDEWAIYENTPRNQAASGSGTLNIQGSLAVLGEIIEQDTYFETESGIIYATDKDVDCILYEYDATITFDGSKCTVETDEAHGLASGQNVIVAYGVITENGSDITVIDENTIEFDSATGSATETGTLKIYMCVVNCTATTQGINTNIDAGTELLPLDTLLTGFGNAFCPTTIDNGAESETDEELRARVYLARSIIHGSYTATQCILAGLRIAGNKQIIHDPPTAGNDDTPKVAGFSPRSGESVFYVIRYDSDGNITDTISTSVIEATKQSIIDYGMLSANSSEDDLYVFAPVLESVNFTFDSISPDTTGMKTAIENSLNAYFSDNMALGGICDLNKVKEKLVNTQDLDNGQFLDSFSFSVPASNVTPSNAKGILKLGTITWN